MSPNDIDRYSNGREYVSSLNDGIRLLAAHTRPDEKIANLDMFNPFAYAMGREAHPGRHRRGQLPVQRWMIRHHPSPARFFADAAVVMVAEVSWPRHPSFTTATVRSTSRRLEKEFRFEAESPGGGLYRRAAVHH